MERTRSGCVIQELTARDLEQFKGGATYSIIQGQARVLTSTSLTNTVNSDGSWSVSDGSSMSFDGANVVGAPATNSFDRSKVESTTTK